jgi:hypothetical protein
MLGSPAAGDHGDGRGVEADDDWGYAAGAGSSTPSGGRRAARTGVELRLGLADLLATLCCPGDG